MRQLFWMKLVVLFRNSKVLTIKNFKNEGFVLTDKITQNNITPTEVLNEVSTAIKKSIDNNGKVYVHMDGFIEFDAIHDLNNVFHTKATMTEIRYLIDNGIWDAGKVEFRLGKEVLSRNQMDALEAAIATHKSNVETGVSGTFKGFNDIIYNF